jgi:hypothetical protein
VVFDETDAATPNAGIIQDDAFHDSLQLAWLFNVSLDIMDVVIDCHADI